MGSYQQPLVLGNGVNLCFNPGVEVIEFFVVCSGIVPVIDLAGRVDARKLGCDAAYRLLGPQGVKPEVGVQYAVAVSISLLFVAVSFLLVPFPFLPGCRRRLS